MELNRPWTAQLANQDIDWNNQGSRHIGKPVHTSPYKTFDGVKSAEYRVYYNEI